MNVTMPASGDLLFEAMWGRMHVLEREGRLKEALAEAKRAQRYAPTDAEVHAKVGDLMLKSGDKAGAKAEFEAALEYVPDLQSALDGLNIDLAFMATSGFTVENGFTSGSLEESEIKRMVLARAKTKIMLMDRNISCRVLPFTFAQMADIDYLFSDIEATDDIKELAETNHVKIITTGGE
jgi:tetratricopeptide (TPR) repeat protein